MIYISRSYMANLHTRVSLVIDRESPKWPLWLEASVPETASLGLGLASLQGGNPTGAFTHSERPRLGDVRQNLSCMAAHLVSLVGSALAWAVTSSAVTSSAVTSSAVTSPGADDEAAGSPFSLPAEAVSLRAASFSFRTSSRGRAAPKGLLRGLGGVGAFFSCGISSLGWLTAGSTLQQP